jgi:transcriptional regulator with XRE-family HTH domain
VQYGTPPSPRLREAKGWNRRAAAAGVDPATITRLEQGRRDDPRATTITLLARALGDGDLHDPILRQLLHE